MEAKEFREILTAVESYIPRNFRDGQFRMLDPLLRLFEFQLVDVLNRGASCLFPDCPIDIVLVVSTTGGKLGEGEVLVHVLVDEVGDSLHDRRALAPAFPDVGPFLQAAPSCGADSRHMDDALDKICFGHVDIRKRLAMPFHDDAQ